jgi:hypothetical protein
MTSFDVLFKILQVLLEPGTKDRLDKILTHLETQDGMYGNGTMLLLGNSVLHSRFALHETRMVRDPQMSHSIFPCLSFTG